MQERALRKPDRQMPSGVYFKQIHREGLQAIPLQNLESYQTIKYQTSGASKSL